MKLHPFAPPPSAKPVSLEDLFDRFYFAVLALFRRRGFTESQCEDLAQETFLKVHEGLAGYRGEAPIEHWLFRIASNTAKASFHFQSAARRKAREVSLEEATALRPADVAVAEPEEDPLRLLLSSERSQRLSAAVDRMPSRMRCCVRLRLEQDLRYREIAEILQISEQTVKVQLMRARDRLRQVLAEDAGAPAESGAGL